MGIRQYKPTTAGRRCGSVSDWAAVQDSFEKHYMRLFPKTWTPDKRAEMMLLIHSHEDSSETLYMSLPDGEKLYDGFVPATFAELPPDPSLLIGDQLGYSDLFRT